MRDVPAVADAFRSGHGVGWHEHNPDVFHGTERFFRPGYNANLVSSWLPACDGAEQGLAERAAFEVTAVKDYPGRGGARARRAGRRGGDPGGGHRRRVPRFRRVAETPFNLVFEARP